MLFTPKSPITIVIDSEFYNEMKGLNKVFIFFYFLYEVFYFDVTSCKKGLII